VALVVVLAELGVLGVLAVVAVVAVVVAVAGMLAVVADLVRSSARLAHMIYAVRRYHLDVTGIDLIALGMIVFAEGVGGRHLELTPVVRGALTFGAALMAGLIGALALDDLDVSETAAGVGVTTVIALGLEHTGGPASLATSGAVLLGSVAGACAAVAALRGVRRPRRWSLPAAAGFLTYGVCVLIMLGAIAFAGMGKRATMLQPMLSQYEPGGTILSSALVFGVTFGLAAAWWLVPRSHVLDGAFGAGVVLEAVARLGGGGLEVVWLSFFTPLLLLSALIALRAKWGRPPFPKRREPAVSLPPARVEQQTP